MMKYLFFDCHGGFDLQMAVSAIIDMTENDETAREAASLLPIAGGLSTSRVKRCGMDALLAQLETKTDEEGSIAEIIEALSLSDSLKSKLKLWHKLRSDGKPYNREKEQRELCYAVLCLILVERLGIERIYISEILQGNAMGTEGADLKIIPSAHTELLTKMAGLRTRSVNIPKEILEPSAAALLYIINAEYLPPRMHNVIKSGYGASQSDLSEVPNIARAVIAEDGEASEEVYRDFEAIISDMEFCIV